MGCLRAKPVVDGLEREVGDQAIFLRVDLLGEVGEQLGDRFDIHATPSYLAFDRHGALAFKRQGGGVPVAELRRALASR